MPQVSPWQFIIVTCLCLLLCGLILQFRALRLPRPARQSLRLTGAIMQVAGLATGVGVVTLYLLRVTLVPAREAVPVWAVVALAVVVLALVVWLVREAAQAR